MKKIILASQSSARKEIFSSLGIPFEIIPAHIDEQAIRDKNLKKRALKIAKTKALTISQKHEGVIIAADTFDVCNGEVFEKPKNVADAKRMLRALSGNKAYVITGFCYIDKDKKIEVSTTVTVSYTFRKLYNNEIDKYVKEYPVTLWAAGFALVFPYINTFIAEVNGSLTGLAYGLPTEILIPLLKRSGFEPNPKR